ncbi:hypothetical protein [Streptomyces sp. NPDC017993]|uniref:hypothetical protein n=1 Tax=Streptomyces sp. NPDC017993 TaxID=3365027 RepID=UPI00378972B2
MKHDEPLSHAELLGAYWLDTPYYGPAPWVRTAERPSSLRVATGGPLRAAGIGLAVVTILAAALSAWTHG